MSSKLLFSSLVIGGGSIAAGGYGVYLATTPSFNPLEVAEKVVKTTKLLKETFKDLKDAKKKFLESLSKEPQKPEEVLEDKKDEHEEQLPVNKTNEQKIQELFKNIFLSKELNVLLSKNLKLNMQEKIEKYKESKIDQDYESLKNSWESTNEWTKVISLAKKFADQIIFLYDELSSLFKDQLSLFGTAKLEDSDENPLENSLYSQALMSIPEKIILLEDNKNSKKENEEGEDNEDQNRIEDNIFNLKISGTPISDDEEFVTILSKDNIFEVTQEDVDKKTLTLKLKTSEEQSENMWTYFEFNNEDLKDWKEIITGKKYEEMMKSIQEV